MRLIAGWTLTTIVLLCAANVGAQPLGPRSMISKHSMMGRPAFLEHVFRPELIMRHQREIELTSSQQEAISESMKETQRNLVDLRWQFEAESQELAKILEGKKVDEAAALAQAQEVMNTEQRIKKEHLGMLIRTKNHLKPEQQEKLRKLRPTRRGGRSRK